MELIQKLQNNQKASVKAFQKLLKDLAIWQADRLENLPRPRPKFFCLHRKDGIEPDFINTFLRHAPEEIFYFLTVSESVASGAKGHMVLRGDPELVEKFGALFMEKLEGKGNGKEGSFQGKITNINKIAECESLLEEHFKSTIANNGKKAAAS